MSATNLSKRSTQFKSRSRSVGGSGQIDGLDGGRRFGNRGRIDAVEGPLVKCTNRRNSGKNITCLGPKNVRISITWFHFASNE